MKVWLKLLICSLLAWLFVLVGPEMVPEPILAVDNSEELKNVQNLFEKSDGDELLEEGGELLGWVTAVTMGGAFFIMILKRNRGKLMNVIPNIKGFTRSSAKYSSRFHIWIGTIALILSGTHGTIMFLHEREFEFEVVLGMISFSLLAIAALFGIQLARKKNIIKIRSIHFGILYVVILLSIVHIFVG